MFRAVPTRSRAALAVLATVVAGLAFLPAGIARGQTSQTQTPARGPAYWLAGSDGGVFSFGDASFAGSLANARLNQPIVAMASTPTGSGYWLAAADGGVFAYGDAVYAGAAAHQHLHAPIVGIAATPTGNGYWLAGADGGVFAYGDAVYAGSAAHQHLHAPIVGITATPTGHGYWLAAADGGVFAYGDAEFAGAATHQRLHAPIVGIDNTPSGEGYWLAGADGGVFAFGDAVYAGAAVHQHLHAPVVGIAATWDGRGYWLASADGGVFAFGDAGYYGSRGGQSLSHPVTAIAAGLAPHRPHPAPATLSDAHGYDISWPQCGSGYPTSDVGFGIVGVTGGTSFTVNPCLADEVSWSHGAGRAAGLYVNLNAPYASDVADPGYLARINSGLEGNCAATDPGCQMGNFGAAAADAAWNVAQSRDISAPTWWLDVETTSNWNADPGLNARIIRGAYRALRRHGVGVGIYSTPYQWQDVAGSLQLKLPVWVAGAPDAGSARAWCDGRASFNGGPVWLVQALPTAYDEDVACGPVLAHAGHVFTRSAPPSVPVVVPAWRAGGPER